MLHDRLQGIAKKQSVKKKWIQHLRFFVLQDRKVMHVSCQKKGIVPDGVAILCDEDNKMHRGEIEFPVRIDPLYRAI